jgi:nucleolar protein 53
MSIPSYIPKEKRREITNTQLAMPPEGKQYDVWNKVEVIPSPKDLPPPATLSYSKSVPARAPSTMRSTQRRLRPREKAKAVTVAGAGQSYNPTLEDWEDLINQTAVEEQHRLHKIANKEWVPKPEETEPSTVKADSEEEQEPSETFLGKPVQVRRKTKAQRNRQARHAETVFILSSTVY